MTQKRLAYDLTRAISASMMTLALVGFLGLGLSGCGGDSGSGDSNFSQKFENAPAPTGGQTKSAAPIPGNPDGQTPKERRARDRAEDLKGKR